MKKILAFLKKEPMLLLSMIAAVSAMILNPPTADLPGKIDWRTLGTLFMMLTILEGFKKENIFRPLIRFSTRFRSVRSLSLFLVFCVFFTSMFVTNDVSLIIFVPLTIMLFRKSGKEQYILPVISMENIAAIRGSLLMPFGSPQNLFLYGRFGVGIGTFMLHMSPLCVSSALLLIVFIVVMSRKERGLAIDFGDGTGPGEDSATAYRKPWYLVLFAMVMVVIITKTQYWPVALGVVFVAMLILDRSILLKTDYVILATFFCFFVFSSLISTHPSVSEMLGKLVAGHEYWWAIGISQIISNVPASIVLYPFSTNNAGLIYGLDTAGLCSLIGSLASVINYRIYVREYPGKGKAFVKTFTLISWAFFAIVVIPGWLLSRWAFV